ncbi:MAG: extracellular solute-binding protein [Sphaerochaetaceae bacterium]|nr:extracellular solute-binding protein [Sphaerochaetaceae bacterium]
MKKILALVMVSLIAVTSFFASGANESKSDDGTITLTGYMQIDPANPAYAGHNAVVEAFEEAYPNIKLDIEYATGEAFHQKFQAMAASRKIPDIFTCYGGARTAYIQDPGLVLDLSDTDYLTDEFKSQFKPVTFKAQGENGELWMIPPTLAVCHVVFANRAILDELGLDYPKTFEEMIAQVPTIRAAGYYPISMGNKDQWVVNSWLLSLLVDRTGGPQWFMDAAKGENGAKFTDPAFVKTLEIIQTMCEEDLFSPGVNQMGNGEADQEFYQGKSVYLIDAGWRSGGMDSQLPTEFTENIEMHVFPAIEGEVRSNTSTAVTGEGFGIASAIKDTEKADAAWKFISFYTGEEGSKIFAQYGDIPTCNIDFSEIEMGIMQKKYAQFQEEHEMGYVFDSVMNGEGVSLLNANIQAMMMGNGDPSEIATQYEAWVAQNDTNRE